MTLYEMHMLGSYSLKGKSAPCSACTKASAGVLALEALPSLAEKKKSLQSSSRVLFSLYQHALFKERAAAKRFPPWPQTPPLLCQSFLLSRRSLRPAFDTCRMNACLLAYINFIMMIFTKS
mmetsp:Transcript_5527/g.11366  ORF Transcript_5527/g.11366 Transcript_5527/m.11366 type:complete len:121 (+) Transcript_5527:641-1003(+)|eukprot:CAMPEP_0171526212 /NCGR_PEP_ID=MMETSP0959-20130129/10249_1 /TAXON_ID=87120 /ORGANISM="Aurantiochytrium limacinum, Strain ATCCMYA-1381" /LENGTH=120 /DNA_ID=CAMNT_0012067573 /DNA_START=618 /DNA_END=980 /DNA_ORIENTATION=-